MSTQSHFPMVCFRAASISQAKPAAISIGASEHRPGFEGVGDGIHIAGSWRKPRKPRLEPVATDLVSADRVTCESNNSFHMVNAFTAKLVTACGCRSLRSLRSLGVSRVCSVQCENRVKHVTSYAYFIRIKHMCKCMNII